MIVARGMPSSRAAAENPRAFATATNADIDSNLSKSSHILGGDIPILASTPREWDP
jgi:hypothetical protein